VTPEQDDAHDDPHDPPRRRVARTPISAEVQLRRSAEHSFRVNVHDLSPMGCRVEFIERPRLEESVWVKFEGIDALESTVRWTEGDFVGLEFLRPLYGPVFEALMSRLS
jgi:hypothetical protein